MRRLDELPVKIFADGADFESIRELNARPLISGLTTNPTLMRRAGVANYEDFARRVLEVVTTKPISFEVFSDESEEMRRQAVKIAAWGSNVYVKVPYCNTRGEPTVDLLRGLSGDGVRLNVTAVLTAGQVADVALALAPDVPAIISIFAGRIADTGVDPAPIISGARSAIAHLKRTETLWASVREVLNVFQAAEAGADIVTVPYEILEKARRMVGMDLGELTLDTVRMFHTDALTAGYTL